MILQISEIITYRTHSIVYRTDGQFTLFVSFYYRTLGTFTWGPRYPGTQVEAKDSVEFSLPKMHILVKYSLLHVLCSHGCFVCIWRYLDQN